MKSIRRTCKPRPEVLESDLKDTIFAADFGHVIEDRAEDVYRTPEIFFQNTYPTATLKKVVTTIFSRLADPNEAGAALRLSTGFGGGKTHTLIALWHLAKNISRLNLGNELLPAAGRPKKVIVAGIDASKFGKPICATHGNIQTHSLWGELAYQLGGAAGYQKMQIADDLSSLPNAQMVQAMLPDEPVLILLDELVIYMAALQEPAQNAILSFINTFISEIGARKQAVLAITDPAGQPVYQKEAAALEDATKLLAAASRMDDVLGRKLSHFDPIGAEAARVISRRLLEDVNPQAAQVASAEYLQTYERIGTDYPELLPPEASKIEYAQRIVESYPFHPRLLETAQERLRALQDFNLSRGTLRLFARILRDLWENNIDIPLITAGDVNWSSDRIQSDLLTRLNRDNFKAAVNADVIRHAGDLDRDFSTDTHQRVASALLLESLPLTSTSAMDKREITLAVLRPSEVGPEPAESLDRLLSVCWHTYPTESGKFQFRYEPNVNKRIEERAENLNIEDAKLKVLALVQNYFGGHTFQLRSWPANPQSVPDAAKIKLVLCESEALAQTVCDYEDDSNPEAMPPRRFRNAILAIAPTSEILNSAVQDMRRLMAADQIYSDEKKTAKGKKKSMMMEQTEDLLPVYRRRATFQAYRAFNRLVLQGRPPLILDEKYLVSDENILGPVSGQARIKEFLDDKKLIYQPNDAIDTNLLMELVQGATPSLEHSGACSASSVHERALASDRLRLMMNEEPIRKSIFNALEQGLIAVRMDNGEVYDKEGCVAGSWGARKRIPGRKLTALPLMIDVLVAPITAPCVQEWLKEDKEIPVQDTITIYEAAEQKGTRIQKIADAVDLGLIRSVTQQGERKIVLDDLFLSWKPDIPVTVQANTWEEAIGYAAKRPLMELKLLANNPNAAKSLLECALPFGAQSLTLTIQVSGDLKDGGKINLLLSKVKHSNALKPVELAQKLFRATSDYGNFEAELELGFTAADLNDTLIKFEQAQTKAPHGLWPKAIFGAERN